MDLSSKWNISSGSSGSSYHKKSDNRISVGKNKTAAEDDIWRGQAAAAPPTTPPPYFGRICPLSTTQHDLYFNRTNIEGFANASIDEARTRKVDNISVNIQNELKKKGKLRRRQESHMKKEKRR